MIAFGGGMKSWWSDESLSVRPKLKLGRDSNASIEPIPVTPYATCVRLAFINFLNYPTSSAHLQHFGVLCWLEAFQMMHHPKLPSDGLKQTKDS